MPCILTQHLHIGSFPALTYERGAHSWESCSQHMMSEGIWASIKADMKAQESRRAFCFQTHLRAQTIEQHNVCQHSSLTRKTGRGYREDLRRDLPKAHRLSRSQSGVPLHVPSRGGMVRPCLPYASGRPRGSARTAEVLHTLQSAL